MMFQSYINDLKKYSLVQNESRFVAQQLLYLHREATNRENVIILELGVDRGQSTKVFLNAIQSKSKSHLVSVDIRDCSDITNSEKWTFVKSDSADINMVLHHAPILRNGIDLIYIDSLHTADHVYEEIYGYFPYLNRGGIMYFDDIDSSPYMTGQRKDNISIEIANRKILELIKAVFISNKDNLNLKIHFGSTGLACIESTSELGSYLNEPIYIKKRKNPLAWKLLYKLGIRKQYRHSTQSNDSFLIDVTKYNQ